MQRAVVPEYLKPTKAEPEIEVQVDLPVSRAYDAQQINALNCKLGMIKLDGERLQALQSLGLAAQSLGIATMIHGGVLVTQDQLLQAMAFHSNIVNDPNKSKYSIKQRTEAAKTLGYLAQNLAKVNQSSTKVAIAQNNAIQDNDRKMRQSYQPGVVITLPKDSVAAPSPV